MKTMKVKPSHESQGEFVVINVDDFDAAVHVPLDAEKPADAEPKSESKPSQKKGKA